MNRELQTIIVEVEKAVVGKREVIEKILMALLADGHVLLDDIPGVGKTTLAVALSRTLGLTYNRIQFTPDVLPSLSFTFPFNSEFLTNGSTLTSTKSFASCAENTGYGLESSLASVPHNFNPFLNA